MWPCSISILFLPYSNIRLYFLVVSQILLFQIHFRLSMYFMRHGDELG